MICLTFVISFQQWWDSVITRKSYFAFLSYLPKILLAFVIPALDGVYSKIAFWLNDMGKKDPSNSNHSLNNNYELYSSSYKAC